MHFDDMVVAAESLEHVDQLIAVAEHADTPVVDQHLARREAVAHTLRVLPVTAKEVTRLQAADRLRVFEPAQPRLQLVHCRHVVSVFPG